MATQINNTAIVSPKAKLGDNVQVAAYAIIEDDVEIGDGTIVGPHACVYDGARIGKNVKIYQAAAVSNAPQDLKYAGEKTYFYIGDNTIIREYVTLHRGTVDTGKTEIGSDSLIMAYAHVAHDCVIGNNCIIANSVQVAGHISIGEYVIIGGGTVLHQFSTVGKHSMIQGGNSVSADVPPFIMAANSPLKYSGLNVIGLRRRGFSNEDITTLKEAYKIFYFSGLNTSDAKKELEANFKHPYIQDIVDFINQSQRSILKK